MEICSKTLKNHEFKLEVLESGDVIEKCKQCYKIFYHYAKQIKRIDLTKKDK